MPPTPRPDVLDFLATRRSRPAKTLRAPAPDAAALRPMLEIAARTPDHGKLEPWRFVVLQGAALTRLSETTIAHGARRGEPEEKVAKAATAFADAPLVVAVIASPKPSEKVPEIEQHLSAGAVCLALVNAALASGWGANWLSGWMAIDRDWLTEALDLAPQEFVAGFIHIGTESSAPPERPRPDLDAITTWVDA
ncbi:nitroreductase [Roseobacter sp. HKCCA0434]|uniref:nitroreductase family protein n=1 Tax=Roseobacter sp. HKCCA0434 TaxID=3079297 RepID=UPI002905DEC3|nr:nitroreductase [Roseobacter sp. HKCCA0434]